MRITNLTSAQFGQRPLRPGFGACRELWLAGLSRLVTGW